MVFTHFDDSLNKLPGFVRVGAVGEMELTTNFLDPVFSPLFHQPQQNRHFLWYVLY